MAQFQINVATAKPTLDWQGVQQYAHLFRTDWIEDLQTAMRIMRDLRVAYPTANISLLKQTITSEHMEYTPAE
jgi:hypothetical protein